MTETIPVQLQERCAGLVTRLGLASADAVRSVQPLTGGVASDIAAVDVGGQIICMKFALEKLRVAEDWHAPVERNAAEYAWLDFAGATVPGCAPRLFGRDTDHTGFAMEFLQGDDVYLWKTALLDRQAVKGEAAKVGRALGRIHAASAAPGFDTACFQNQADFYDLRLEPYLAFTGAEHPDLDPALQELIDGLESNAVTLIHGDVSPKNILFRGGEPVFLDAECATMGDPSFDVAFCLNHLVLKTIHMPDRAHELMAEFGSFWSGYAGHVSWEDVRQLESRVCALLPALMLARVDGKSPVEYLDDATRSRVRKFSVPLVLNPPATLGRFAEAVRALSGGAGS